MDAAIGVSDQSSLGFSADDVVVALTSGFEVDVEDTDDVMRTVSATSVFAIGPEAWVEEREWLAGDNSSCIVGESLVIPVTLTVEMGDLFVATGDAELIAQHAVPDAIWVDASFPIEPTPDLLALAEALRPAGCSDVPDLWFSNATRVEHPWSSGPVGGLSARACNWEGTLYDWQVPAE